MKDRSTASPHPGKAPVIIHTARIDSRDPDAFNVTRKSGGPIGSCFAPSWRLLRGALDGMALARQEAKRGREAMARAGIEETPEMTEAIAEMLDAAWVAYVPAYTAEMRQSYRVNDAAWALLLHGAPRRVLTCYCTDPERCHRTLLAGILGKLGADVRGEIGGGR